MTTLIVLLAILAFIIFMIKITMKKRKALLAAGFTNENRVINVKYSCGHPDIDKPDIFNIGLKENRILFLTMFNDNVKAFIPGELIKNIILEDESTFSKRVTLTRMALIGIFAFAAKKKEKHELAYLMVEWHDTQFTHSTVMEFEGKGAMSRANQLRNMMIRNLQVTLTKPPY